MYLRRPIFSPGRADELALFQALATASDRLESAKNPTSPATNTTAQSHIPVWEPDGGCPSGWSFAAITESQANSMARWPLHLTRRSRSEGDAKGGGDVYLRRTLLSLRPRIHPKKRSVAPWRCLTTGAALSRRLTQGR